MPSDHPYSLGLWWHLLFLLPSNASVIICGWKAVKSGQDPSTSQSITAVCKISSTIIIQIGRADHKANAIRPRVSYLPVKHDRTVARLVVFGDQWCGKKFIQSHPVVSPDKINPLSSLTTKNACLFYYSHLHTRLLCRRWRLHCSGLLEGSCSKWQTLAVTKEKTEMLSQCCLNGRPASQTLDHHLCSIGSTSLVSQSDILLTITRCYADVK